MPPRKGGLQAGLNKTPKQRKPWRAQLRGPLLRLLSVPEGLVERRESLAAALRLGPANSAVRGWLLGGEGTVWAMALLLDPSISADDITAEDHVVEIGPGIAAGVLQCGWSAAAWRRPWALPAQGGECSCGGPPRALVHGGLQHDGEEVLERRARGSESGADRASELGEPRLEVFPA